MFTRPSPAGSLRELGLELLARSGRELPGAAHLAAGVAAIRRDDGYGQGYRIESRVRSAPRSRKHSNRRDRKTSGYLGRLLSPAPSSRGPRVPTRLLAPRGEAQSKRLSRPWARSTRIPRRPGTPSARPFDFQRPQGLQPWPRAPPGGSSSNRTEGTVRTAAESHTLLHAGVTHPWKRASTPNCQANRSNSKCHRGRLRPHQGAIQIGPQAPPAIAQDPSHSRGAPVETVRLRRLGRANRCWVRDDCHAPGGKTHVHHGACEGARVRPSTARLQAGHSVLPSSSPRVRRTISSVNRSAKARRRVSAAVPTQGAGHALSKEVGSRADWTPLPPLVAGAYERRSLSAIASHWPFELGGASCPSRRPPSRRSKAACCTGGGDRG